MEYQETFLEYQEAFMEYTEPCMEDQEGLWNTKKLYGILTDSGPKSIHKAASDTARTTSENMTV